MPGYYENKRDVTVLNALTKRGMAMYLLNPTDTFNEETGAVVEDTAPASTKVYGLVLSYERRERGVGSEIENSQTFRTVKKVMISATGVSTPPTPDMLLKIGTVTHEILSAEPFAPGGVDLYYDLRVAI